MSTNTPKETMKKFKCKTTKPRVRFCWICGKKLYGNHHLEKSIPKLTGDDITRILHKQCFIDDYYDIHIKPYF